MTIAIDTASASIKVTTKPTVQTPTISGSTASFQCTKIDATGTVRLTGAAGDNPVGWTLGFVQVEWIETNWAYYIGEHKKDGSLLLQMGKPPARPAQGCRDNISGTQTDIFYNNADNGVVAAGATLPLVLNAKFFDKPNNSLNLVEPNSLTGKSNYLSEAQLEFHFCTALIVRESGGAVHQLASFYWNTHWQATFKLNSFTSPLVAGSWSIFPNTSGTSSNTSGIIKGKVTDPKFQKLVTAVSVPTCNAVAGAAAASVGTPSTATTKTGRHEKATIEMFNVGR